MSKLQSLLYSFIIAFTLAFQTTYVFAHDLQDMTILVSSCDKYSPLWEPFFHLLFKHWPSLLSENKDIPIMLIANTKQFPNARIQTLRIANERSWSDNMIEALTNVKTKYVLIMLEDYWIQESVDQQKLIKIVQQMNKDNLKMVQISYNNPKYHSGKAYKNIPDAVYTDKFAQYKASLQMAIWDKKTLKYLLRPGENPWAFELAGTIRSHGYPGIFLNISSNYPIRYLNATRQGHIEAFALDYLLQNGIKFDRGNIPIVHTSSYKLEYAFWKNRVNKLYEFIKSPGSFYQFKTN